MEVADKIIVVTGGASGIGRAMVERFASDGAKKVVVADLDGEGEKTVADAVGGWSMQVDVSREADIIELIEQTESQFGPIDLFCSNAGIGLGKGLDEPDEVWQKIWEVNTMSHVYAARHLVPRMKTRGGGYLLNTSSAAGLLTQIGSVTYAVTKHAAVALAEWIANHPRPGWHQGFRTLSAGGTHSNEGRRSLGCRRRRYDRTRGGCAIGDRSLT